MDCITGWYRYTIRLCSILYPSCLPLLRSWVCIGCAGGSFVPPAHCSTAWEIKDELAALCTALCCRFARSDLGFELSVVTRLYGCRLLLYGRCPTGGGTRLHGTVSLEL